MKKTVLKMFLFVSWLAWVLFFLPTFLTGAERFQIELYGGISFIDPKDFNLFSQAEQQYNDIYFIQRLRYYGGYFVNDFPEIRETIPAGLRLRYGVSEKLSFSLALEGFIRKKKIIYRRIFRLQFDCLGKPHQRIRPLQARIVRIFRDGRSLLSLSYRD